MINYSLISDSISFYEKKGYTRVESPWTVTPDIANITKPTEIPLEWKLNHNGKVLVASGEQSFLYLYLKEFLPLGKYMSITPCFRSDTFDQLHTKYFIKNELIVTDLVNSTAVEIMANQAIEFFAQIIPKEIIKLVRVETRNTASMKELCAFDVVACIDGKEIELGSYGMRECSFLKWAYGTGCAEPRLSHVIKQVNLACL